MTINTHIKRNAKRALRGQWSKGIAAGMVLLCANILLLLLEYTVFSILSSKGYKEMLSEFGFVRDWVQSGRYDAMMHLLTLVMIGFLMFFLVIPLMFGFIKWSFAVASAESAPVTLLFYYYTGVKKYFKSIKVSLLLFIRIVGYTVLSLLPGAFIYTIGVFYRRSDLYIAYVHRIIVYFSVLVLLIGIICGVFTIMKYILVSYMHVDNPGLTPSQLIAASSLIMKHERLPMIALVLSMIPLAVLCVLIVPVIFIMPYFNVVFAIYAKYMIEKGKRDGILNNEGSEARQVF